jgi:protein tyrosine/serine phosphatase
MADNASISPPFVQVLGLPNFRDIGGYPIVSSKGKIVRTGVVFRSSEPSKLAEEGVARLQALGIKDVYDLRSQLELVRDAQNGNGRQARTWAGANRIVAPVFSDVEYTPEAIAARFRMYAANASTTPIVLAHMREILKAASAEENPDKPYRNILQHLARPGGRGHGPSPILIHCSAGKDRTGVICALILSLCGVDDEVVAHEYSLSELGLQSRPDFLRNLLEEPVVKGNAAAAMEMVGSR